MRLSRLEVYFGRFSEPLQSHNTNSTNPESSTLFVGRDGCHDNRHDGNVHTDMFLLSRNKATNNILEKHKRASGTECGTLSNDLLSLIVDRRWIRHVQYPLCFVF